MSPELAELAKTGAVSQVTELSNRRRLTTFFTNEQSPFYGVQLNYVNVGLGNLTFLNRDLVRADRVPIVFGRVYDSRRTTGADFGPGWKLSVVESIQPRGSRLLYADASGSEYVLTIDGGRIFSEHPHLTGIKEGRVQGKAIELEHNGLHKRFERAGEGYRLVEVRDNSGGAVRLKYKAGLVERISTSHQRFVDLIRDGSGRIVAAHDDAGRRTTYGYDAKGRLAIVTDLGGQRWQIGYDSQGSLAHVTDPRGAAALQASFDSAGRIQQVRVLFDSTSFDYQSGQTTVLNAMQQSAVFWHESSGLTRAVKDFAGELTEIEFDDRLQPVSLSFNGARIADLTYDSNRRLHTVSDRLDESTPRTVFEYDSSGRLLSESSDGTSIKRYRYDSLGNVISALDEARERTYTYQVNRLQSIKVGKSVLELDTNDLGQLTRFASTEQQVLIDYDRKDRVQSLRYAMKGVEAQSRYAYGTQGLRTDGVYTVRTDARGKASAKRMEAKLALTYDAVGNLTGVHEEAEGKTFLSQSYLLGDRNQLQRLTTNGRSMDYEYDAAGRVSQIRVDGRVVTFEYDALGRLAGTSLNGRQLVTSDYGTMDVDVAAEADGYSPFTVIAAPIASAVFANLDAISYARPRGTPFGPIRFDATMARFILAKSLMPAPDAVLLASLKRRALPIGSGGHHDYGNKQPTMVSLAPIGFDKPSNGLFLPAEFSSLNCYQCYAYISPAIVMAVNGSTAGAVPVTVGQPVSFDTYDPTEQSLCSYPMYWHCDAEGCFWWYESPPPNIYTAYGDGTSESGFLQYSPGSGSLHTYLAPGQFTVETIAACNECPGAPYTCAACPGAQFIQVAAAQVQAQQPPPIPSVNVRYTMFIPLDHVRLPVNPVQLFYAGDSKDSHVHTPGVRDFRVQQEFTIDLNTRTVVGHNPRSGTTDGYSPAGEHLVSSSCFRNDCDVCKYPVASIFLGADYIFRGQCRTGTPSCSLLASDMQTVRANVISTTSSSVTVEFAGDPDNACQGSFAGVSLAADISWLHTVTIDWSSGTATYSLSLSHDGFPSHQIDLNNVTRYSYTPIGNGDPLSLAFPRDKSANRQGAL